MEISYEPPAPLLRGEVSKSSPELEALIDKQDMLIAQLDEAITKLHGRLNCIINPNLEGPDGPEGISPAYSGSPVGQRVKSFNDRIGSLIGRVNRIYGTVDV